jgi:hypothetical protein
LNSLKENKIKEGYPKVIFVNFCELGSTSPHPIRENLKSSAILTSFRWPNRIFALRSRDRNKLKWAPAGLRHVKAALATGRSRKREVVEGAVDKGNAPPTGPGLRIG